MPADAPTTVPMATSSAAPAGLQQGQTELLLIRHAPALTEGRMAGRRDVAADCSDALAFAALRGAVGAVDHCLISPALRCVQTAATLWPEGERRQVSRLWEQDFGAWEDVAFADLPDLGTLSGAELAAHQPPGGESFLALCARVTPALQEAVALGGKVVIVAHAGVIRAALGLALGAPELGLVFQVAPLSLTTIIALPGGIFSIVGVNRMRR
ncbi:histidine phosphatase family protein [Cypionkella sp.]|uniref:histidine phosphatase family protein n=1 Tax=Cypionkella sp. TaxID=2811411 RepID=UPI00262A75DB|nr:histidine phosphatase family protein [Cypionkella sp.]MDB5664285.1 phosphoglycerate mutase [Cypionkella sp.]